MHCRLVAGLICFIPFTAPVSFAAGLLVAEAASRGDRPAVRALLQQKADVNAALPDGTTALHWAVRTDDVELTELLIGAGAKVTTADRYGITPLSLAASNGNVAIIGKLLDAGADASSADARGETALMTAARNRNLDALRLLVSRGADVNAKDTGTHTTALMWAVRQNDAAAVEFLLSRGADVNARTRIGEVPPRRPQNAGGGSHGLGIVRGGVPDRGSLDPTPGGMSPLLYAARDGRLELARMLLTAGANVNLPEANGITPLIMATANNHVELARFFLEHGADIQAADAWGRTPLWTAIDLRNLDVDFNTLKNGVDRAAALELVKALLDRGAPVNVRTKEIVPVRRFMLFVGDLSWVDFTGETPFVRAALAGDITVMRLLLDHGADPNIPTNSNSTALMAAAGVNWAFNQTYTESKESLLEAVKLCLEKGADVNAVNSMGLTAVFGAVNRGSDDILEYLVQKGARLDLKDKEGRTLLNWAEGVFLATHPPVAKPSTITLLHKLMGDKTVASR